MRLEQNNQTHGSSKARISIQAPQSGFDLNIREIWNYRELLFIFIWRDTAVRYKQSIVGIGWVVIQPLVTMIIFSIIFGKLAKLPSDGSPYPIFTFCALLPWNYFARSLSDSSDSLVGSANIITKVYFPRLLLPVSKVFVALIDLLISFIVLLIMMLWYKILPTIGVIFLPFFIIIAMLTALGAGLWLTALNVKYRDIRFVVPFLSQIWMYLSPVAYSINLIPEKWQWFYGINPMVGVIEGFRWALLSKTAPNIAMMIISFSFVIILLISGVYYFKSTEHTFTDII